MDNTYGANIFEKFSIQKAFNGFVCSGTKNDCWAEIDKGGRHVSFGKSIEEVSNILLKPNLKKIINCKSLDFLPKETTFLDIPLPLIDHLSNANFPELKHLKISNKESYLDVESFFFENFSLDPNINLKSLHFYGDCEKAGEHWVNCNINIANYQSLDFFSSVLDKNGLLIKQLSELRRLKYLDLSLQHSVDLFDGIKHLGLVLLSLNQLKSDFDFSNLKDLVDLEILIINDCSTEFDCSMLKMLPKLREIDFMGIKKIRNWNKLLEMENLESITIIDCNNPFNKKEIVSFSSHNFNYLDIELS